ncbi:hypothetical protein L249_3765 [Ophiocordyceps polyrhachis-furcata BCC 54312]|uniref:Uncharacterized protein n=1 Tax=Ophiocordyceps polyrhachis-furcata BCC 54312 TaxID=1330021 RepID=A0A367L4M2_9HYPO|nr:hypothetical protein L249_3765 [Ophiocordyceps polyrhachis-furcata BCC 54312]
MGMADTHLPFPLRQPAKEPAVMLISFTSRHRIMNRRWLEITWRLFVLTTALHTKNYLLLTIQSKSAAATIHPF